MLNYLYFALALLDELVEAHLDRKLQFTFVLRFIVTLIIVEEYKRLLPSALGSLRDFAHPLSRLTVLARLREKLLPHRREFDVAICDSRHRALVVNGRQW